MLKKQIDNLKLTLKRFLFRCQRNNMWRFSDPLNKFYVSPKEISLGVCAHFNKWKDKGKILGGNWDKDVKPFSEFDVFQSFTEHFCHQKGWIETDFYKRILATINSGEIKWGCSSEKQLLDRFDKLDQLYHTIKKTGYLPQDQIENTKNTTKTLYDEISICIDRHGQYLFHDGRHRLSISKILDLKEIPIQITLRHKDWYNFCKEVTAYANQRGGKIYSPVMHIDLAHIPSQHGHDRFRMLQDNMPLESGTLLDIGAHWGYFCHRFEDKGFQCTAIESSPLHQHFIKKLKIAKNKKFSIINNSVLDINDDLQFDVVLGLNIFHHFLKTEVLLKKFKKLLNKLDIKIMFFESHIYSEPQMKTAYLNLHPDEFADFILEHSCLNKKETLGQSSSGRTVFKLFV